MAKAPKPPRGPRLLDKAIGKERGARAEAARRTGFIPSELTAYLAGRRTPTLAKAYTIEQAYPSVPGYSWLPGWRG